MMGRVASRLVALARPAGTRSEERYRRAAVTFLASIATKGVALAVLLISVPLGLGYLGSERFGLWMTAVSAAGLLSFAVLGLDKGLLNALAAADGGDDRAKAGQLVSTAFVLLGGVFAGLLLLLALLYPVLPWARLFNAGAGVADEAGSTMAALAVCALLSLLASLVDTVQAAYQDGFRNVAWDGVGKLLALLALVAAIAAGAGLPMLALAVAAAPLAAAGANAALLFAKRRRWLVPRLSLVRRAAARQLLSAGGWFFLSQVALTLAYHADTLIVAQLAGSNAAGSYAVVSRLFDIPGMLLLLVGGALWPPLVEAIARGDVAWAERGLKRLVLASLALALAAALPLMLLGPPLLRWWVGGALAAPAGLFVAFGVFWLLSALTQPIAVFLGAAGALRFQLAISVLLVAGGLPLKLGLAREIGMEGVAWGRVGAEVLFVLIPGGLFLPRLLRRLRRGAAPVTPL
jgi:O-antigen/teichoic acid export membrane protein